MADEPIVTFHLISPTLDQEERDEEARQLGSELRESGIDARVVTDGGEIPGGAKSGIPVELASTIAVGLATTALEELIRYTWSWLRRRKAPQKLKMSVSGGDFELSSEMSRDQLKSLLDTISAAAAGASAT
jgi:hypothetical protein